MAELTRSSRASMDASTGMFAPQISGLVAGEDLVIGPCYIKSSDGKVYKSTGAAANEAAEFIGFAARAAKSGQPVTVFGVGARFKYSDGALTPGDKYFIGATAGSLDTAATTGGTVAVARAITAHDIVIIRNSE